MTTALPTSKLAVTSFEEVRIAFDARSVIQIQDSASAKIDLARILGLSVPSADHDRFAMQIRHGDSNVTYVRVGTTVEIVETLEENTIPLPNLIAPSLQAKGITSLIRLDGSLLFLLDANTLMKQWRETH